MTLLAFLGNVERVTGVVCKPGWKGDRCEQKSDFNVNDFCKTWGGKKLLSSNFKNGKLSGFFDLVRRVAKGTKWHPVNDDLRGTAKYGTPPTNPTSGPTGTAQWTYYNVQYFLFSTGDYSEWFVGAMPPPMRLTHTDMLSCLHACV